MKAQGDKAFDPLIDLIKRGSPFEKGAALSALASTTDAAIAAKLRDMAIAEESPFTGRQSNRLVTGLLSQGLLVGFVHFSAVMRWRHFLINTLVSSPDMNAVLNKHWNGFSSASL